MVCNKLLNAHLIAVELGTSYVKRVLAVAEKGQSTTAVHVGKICRKWLETHKV